MFHPFDHKTEFGEIKDKILSIFKKENDAKLFIKDNQNNEDYTYGYLEFYEHEVE